MQPPNTIAAQAAYNPAVISSQPAAEALKVFMESIEEITKNHNNIFKINVLPVSRSEFNILFVSAIVLCVSYAEGADQSVAYHTMLLADTAPELPPKPISVGGRQVELIQVVGDAYDKAYKQAVGIVVRRSFPNVNPANLLDAEAEVIPRRFDFKNPNAVLRVLSNATAACGTILNTNSPNHVDFSLANGNAAALNTTARLQFNQPQRSDAVNEPRRADVLITLTEVTAQQNQNNYSQPNQIQSLNSGDQNTHLFDISGYMDLKWHPEAPQGMQSMYAPPPMNNQQVPTVLYTANFIVTEVNSPMLRTLPAQMLGVATLLTLSDNSNWVHGFNSQNTPNARLHNIGAVGYEAPHIRDMIDTKADAFRGENFIQLMRDFVRPRISISYDVPECGPDTWLSSMWLATALGSHDANNAIIEACDILTGGGFSKIYPANMPVVVDDGNRVHLGHYMLNGVPTDLREIDYLAVLNATFHKNPMMIREYSDSFVNLNEDMNIRLATRRRIIEEVAASSEINYTGYARRLSFNATALDCLARSVLATGLSIRPITPQHEMSGQPRAVAGNLDMTLVNQGNTGLFSRSYGQTGGAGAPGQGTWGRWGS